MNRKPLFAAAGVCALGAAWYWENRTLSVGEFTVRCGLSSPVRIVSLADLHGTLFGPRGNTLLSRVRALAPDLIVLPGDTLDASCRNLALTVTLVRRLCALAPVYMIPGNHELRSGRAAELLGRFRAAGAHCLVNERSDGSVRGVPLHILGLSEGLAVSRLDYLRAALGLVHHADNRTALSELEQLGGLRLVLSHFPETFAEIGAFSYGRFHFDLMLCGHAHGGQIRLPGIGGLYAPGQGLLPRYDAGLYRLTPDGPSLLVSRGLGNDAPIPRIGNRPEICLVTVL
ncbi:MAG: metallophosphoesterase [Oscillospiraceae bacterium]